LEFHTGQRVAEQHIWKIDKENEMWKEGLGTRWRLQTELDGDKCYVVCAVLAAGVDLAGILRGTHGESRR